MQPYKVNEVIEISVVVPVYKSESILPELVKRINQCLRPQFEFEIILVDDCSPDQSWNIIRRLAEANPEVRGFRMGKNAGQFMTTLAGAEQARGKYLVTIDDDLEYHPEDILALYQCIRENDYYLVFGLAPEKYRKQHKNPWVAHWRNKLLNFVWQKFITDSYKIFHRRVLFDEQNRFAPKIHFEAFVNHYLAERFVGYIEVGYHERFHGSSNHTLWKKLRIFFKYSIEFYPFPIVPFSAFLLGLFFAGGLVDYLIFNGKLNGLMLYLLGFSTLFTALGILQYSSHIFSASRNMPSSWIIESTDTQ